MPVSRIWITGSSGAGKTTMASEIERRLQLPHLELDGLYHGPDWIPADPEVFRSAVLEVVDGPRWVVDGNYTGALGRTVADRAQLRIAIDLSVPVTMSRVIRRRCGVPSPAKSCGTAIVSRCATSPAGTRWRTSSGGPGTTGTPITTKL